MMKNCGAVGMIAYILVIVGALNWGLVGIGLLMGQNWDLVNLILGSIPYLAEIVYILVGVSAVVMLFACKSCKVGGSMM